MLNKKKEMIEDSLLAAAKTFESTFVGDDNEENLYRYAYNYISELKTENAKLNERLNKAIESLCKIGDTVYMYGVSLKDGYNEKDEVVRYIDVGTTCIEVTEDNIYQVCDLLYHKKAFFSENEAKDNYEQAIAKVFPTNKKVKGE